MLRVAIPVMAAFLLSACASVSTVITPPPELPLMDPASLRQPRLLKQTVEFRWQQEQQLLIVVGELRHEGIRLLLLSPLGQSLGRIEYDGQQVVFESEVPELQLPVHAIVAQMQFSLWPQASVRQAFDNDDGWHLDLTDTHRQARYRGQEVLRVDYRGDELIVEHQVLGYTATVVTLESKPL